VKTLEDVYKKIEETMPENGHLVRILLNDLLTRPEQCTQNLNISSLNLGGLNAAMSDTVFAIAGLIDFGLLRVRHELVDDNDNCCVLDKETTEEIKAGTLTELYHPDHGTEVVNWKKDLCVFYEGTEFLCSLIRQRQEEIKNRKNLFVSYSYIARQGETYFTGFGNCILKGVSEPREDPEVELEEITNMVNEKARENYSSIACIPLYFKNFSRKESS